jgi:hypothetical protein
VALSVVEILIVVSWAVVSFVVISTADVVRSVVSAIVSSVEESTEVDSTGTVASVLFIVVGGESDVIASGDVVAEVVVS